MEEGGRRGNNLDLPIEKKRLIASVFPNLSCHRGKSRDGLADTWRNR